MGIKEIVLWLVVIIVVILTTAAVIAVVTGFVPGNPMPGLSTGRFTSEVDQNRDFTADGISKIHVKSVSPEINIIAAEGQQIRAHLHGETVSVAPGQPVKLETQLRGDTLVIEAKPRPNISINKSSVTLDVYVPAGFDGDMQLETISGGIRISDLDLNRLNAKSVSGGIDVSSVNTAATSVKATSGGIRLRDFGGDLDFDLVSGFLDAGFINLNPDVTGKTVSGSLTLRLPDDASFELDAGTISGTINCDFPVTVTGTQPKRGLKGTIGSGSGSIGIQTVSGSINIYTQ